MSCLYKRTGSHYYQWTAYHKGRKLRKSTGMTQKHLARKVQEKWDFMLFESDLSFLGNRHNDLSDIKAFIRQYLKYISGLKSNDAVKTARGIISRFSAYLEKRGIKHVEEINAAKVSDYISWLDCSPKTKKNHLIELKLMMDYAIMNELVNHNPAKDVKLPKIVQRQRHRLLEQVDLEIIFISTNAYKLFYAFLYHTGLRAGDVARLKFSNIDFQKKAIISFVRKSRRIHEFPIADALVEQLPKEHSKDEQIFPYLYSENDLTVKGLLAKPRKYMQELLKAHARPHATLHSFRHTFNESLRNLGLSIEDRQVLLAHASSQTTMIYTHPNFNLARDYVNKIHNYACHTGQ